MRKREVNYGPDSNLKILFDLFSLNIIFILSSKFILISLTLSRYFISFLINFSLYSLGGKEEAEERGVGSRDAGGVDSEEMGKRGKERRKSERRKRERLGAGRKKEKGERREGGQRGRAGFYTLLSFLLFPLTLELEYSYHQIIS